MNTILKRPIVNDSDFLSKFLRIAIPVTMQSFFAASLNLVDNIMVGQLGETSIAGVGLANQFCFIMQVILFAITSAVSIFISQFWGAKNVENVRKALGLGLILAGATSFLFFIAALLFPEEILRIFSSDPSLVEAGSRFLRIISFSFMTLAISLCFGSALRSTGTIILPMMTSVLALGLNTLLNYVLIFGKFGIRPMGIEGAATATVISRLVELSVLITVTYSKKNVIAAKINELFNIQLSLVKHLISTSGAVIIKDAIWVVGISTYMIVYAKIGKEAVAALNIVSTVRQLAYVFFNGISSACLIMVGNQLGANCLDTAFSYSKKFLKITLVCSLVIGGLIIAVRHLILMPYNVSEEVVRDASSTLVVYGAVFIFEVFNMVTIVGVLRSGGDIKFCIVMDMIAAWVIGLPMALIGGLVLKLNVEWVFLMVNLQELFKFIICIMRFYSRKWCRNIVSDIN